MKSINKRLTGIKESATVSLADKVRKLRALGHSIIGLQTGDPNFPTPKAIIDEAYKAMKSGQTHYADSRGLPELHQAIADKLDRVNGVKYDAASEILVTNGGVHAYYTALSAILNTGDEVLVPDPAWMLHSNMVKVLGGTPVRVPALMENGFWPTLEDWESAITDKTTTLIINSPNNPTGAVASRDYLKKVNQFAAKHKLWVISDEVYENIIFDGREHVCFATLPQAKSRTIIINSLSKTYAMTGWRVGYLVAPKEIINLALKSSQHTITNVAPFTQLAAKFALSDAAMQEEAKKMVLVYANRRDIIMKLWKDRVNSPIAINELEGAFYYFIDARKLKIPSIKMSERLLEKKSVAYVAGSAFGPSSEGFLRMTIAASDEDIKEGFKRLLDWAEENKKGAR